MIGLSLDAVLGIATIVSGVIIGNKLAPAKTTAAGDTLARIDAVIDGDTCSAEVKAAAKAEIRATFAALAA